MQDAIVNTDSTMTPSRQTKPVVACQRLTKVFRDFWMRSRARAVDGVDFQITPGEIFGLLGPNGSGKSTIIKMMLGLLRPTSGRVAVFGMPPTDVAIKKRIGYLPEESYLYQFLNARETLDYYGRLFEIGHKTRAKRVDELLEMVGLTGAQFRPVREYSKGMQRRIGLAQALINDPDFLVLDEPTTGLDPIGTKQVKDLIVELGRRGKTVLLSSHLLTDVEDVVDRMVILYGGKIRSTGTCDQLLEAQNRTTIEADSLDDETVSKIDELIRVRTGGESAVLRVSRPRQKLEDLFLDIVERARTDRLETSGATAGGVTAAFLAAEELGPKEGGELIDTLVSSRSMPEPEIFEPHAPLETDKVSEEDQQASVISRLVDVDDTPASVSADSDGVPAAPNASEVHDMPERTGSKDAPNVDRSVIDSLLGGGTGKPGTNDSQRGSAGASEDTR